MRVEFVSNNRSEVFDSSRPGILLARVTLASASILVNAPFPGETNAENISQPANRVMTDTKEKSFHARWGVRAALLRWVMNALGRHLGLHVYGIFTRQMELHPGPDPEAKDFTFRMFDSGDEIDLIAASASPELGMSAAFIRNALGKRDVCEAILCEGKIVAYNWSAFTPTEDEQSVFTDFGEDYRYCYKALTLPEYRGHHLLRVYTPLRDRYSIQVRKRTHTIAFISIDNRPSIQAATAIGYRRVGFAGYLARGSVFLPFRTGGARVAGFRFFRPA